MARATNKAPWARCARNSTAGRRCCRLLSDEQITAPQLDDNWSIKDMVAHLRAWQQRSIARLRGRAAQPGAQIPRLARAIRPGEEGQPHDLNAWLYAASRDQPWSSVHQDWREGFLRFLELGEAIPENDLLEGTNIPG